jgi:hypothetical protein
MTQEEKELLLNDICTRLPYGVKCQVQEDEYTYIGTLCRIEVDNKNGHLLDFAESISGLDCQVYLSEIKPYLIPMSSMTEEQKRDLTNLFNCTVVITEWEIIFPNYYDNNMDNWNKVFNWCYKNHFDCNGLIPLGLALKAPDGMYN